MNKILLTGGSGLVGSNLRQAATNKGIELTAPSSKELDLLDYSAVLKYIQHLQPDYIIHAAGLVGGIKANMENLTSFLVNNWDMGRNVVLAAQKSGVAKLLNFGGSCIYPVNTKNPIPEDSLLNGAIEKTNEGYAIAKIAIIKLCEYISKDPKYQYKTLIPSNLYGPYDKFSPEVSHFLPAIIRKLHLAKVHQQPDVEIWGSGKTRREALFAPDLTQAILKTLTHFESLPLVTNIGTGTDITIKEYYSIAAEVVGYTGGFSFDLTKPEGVQQKLLDVSRATKWGFKTQTPLRLGIQKTYKYFLSINQE